jgi:hypothetical protein
MARCCERGIRACVMQRHMKDVAARYVADALRNIAESDTGRQSCIDAGVPLALTGHANVMTNM